MMKTYGIHAAHDAAIAGNDLRRAIRALSEDETHPDHIGLGTVADMANVVADALDRYWWSIRPLIDAEAEEEEEDGYRGSLA
jgi:hypothetical protein